MNLRPFKTVRIVSMWRCDHCRAIGGTDGELTVQGCMRKLRAFERQHYRCAPAARILNALEVANTMIERAKKL